MGRRVPRWAVLGCAGTLVLTAAYATTQTSLAELWHVVVPATPERVADQLAGRGVPPVAAYVAVVLLALALAGLLATVRLPTKENGPRPAIIGVVTAIALVAGASALGTAWSHAATEAMANANLTHTRAAGLDDHYDVSLDDGPVDNLRLGWKAQPGKANDTTFLVPGTDFALSYRTTGTAGVIAYDAGTGTERWRYLAAGRSELGGLAVSPESGAVVLVFGDVAVRLGLATGELRWRTVLPSTQGDSRFRVLGDLPGTWTGEHDASPVVPRFRSALLLQQAAGPVVALSLDGEARTIESPPATRCSYAAWYTGEATYLLRQSLGSGTCGLPEVSEIGDQGRVALVQLPAGTLRAGLASGYAGLTLSGQGRLLQFGGDLRSSAIPNGDWTDATLVYAPSEAGAVVQLVQEKADGPARAVDAEGRVTAAGGPLPGYPYATAKTTTAWYRFHRLSAGSGRVEVVRPNTLRVEAPSPAFACADIEGMSVTRGRLLVQCADSRRSVFVFTGG